MCAWDNTLVLIILTTFISNSTQINNTVENAMLYFNQVFPASSIQKPL